MYLSFPNPAADLTFTYILYSYYESSSIYKKYAISDPSSVTTYTIDKTYTGDTIEADTNVKMYPF